MGFACPFIWFTCAFWSYVGLFLNISFLPYNRLCLLDSMTPLMRSSLSFAWVRFLSGPRDTSKGNSKGMSVFQNSEWCATLFLRLCQRLQWNLWPPHWLAAFSGPSRHTMQVPEHLHQKWNSLKHSLFFWATLKTGSFSSHWAIESEQSQICYILLQKSQEVH